MMTIRSIFLVLSVVILLSCNKRVNNETHLMELDFLRKELELDKLIDYNIELELDNHNKFIKNLDKIKMDYFDKKVEEFLNSYDSFGIINVLNRNILRTDEANQLEIDTHIKLIFNPIDYQNFEEISIKRYFNLLKENRDQFSLYKGVEEKITWKPEIIKFEFHDDFAKGIIENLEGAFEEQILLYVLEGIDWVLLIFFALTLIGLPLVLRGLPWQVELGMVVVTIVLSYFFESVREDRIKENIMNNIKSEIISKNNQEILEKFKLNTKIYYYGTN